MSSVACLALIMYMESRGEPLQTQQYVASVAIERAMQEQVTICESMKKPRAYSWMWDRKKTKVDHKRLNALKTIAVRELATPTLKGRMYFNERKLGKLWRTRYKPTVSGNLIFY